MKYAFMTMDVESFYDTLILKDKSFTYDEKYSGEEYIKDYVRLLDKYGIKGTFFTLCSSLPLAQESLKEAVGEGHEIALHGLNHKSPLDMSDEEFENVITKGKEILEERLHTKITGYRAPCWGITDSHVEILKKHGYTYDSSSLNFHLALKSGRINLDEYERLSQITFTKDGFTEIAPNRVKAYSGHLPVSGGGYIRLVPWFVIRYYIHKCINHTDAYMFYVHPYEISKKRQVRIKGLKFVERLFIKIGRRVFLRKIEKIIKYLKKKGFEFRSLGQYAKELSD